MPSVHSLFANGERMSLDHGTGVKYLEIIMAVQVTYKYRGVSYTKVVVR